MRPGVRRTSSGPPSTAIRRRFPSTTTATASRLPSGCRRASNLISHKMGISEWSYHNDYNPASRQKMKHVDLTRRFKQMNIEVELGFDPEQTAREAAALPELRHRDRFHRRALHRVRRLHRHLPGPVPDHHAQRRRGRSSQAALGPGRSTSPGPVRLRAAPANRPHHGQGRGRVRALRPVRRALSHRRVGHAKI